MTMTMTIYLKNVATNVCQPLNTRVGPKPPNMQAQTPTKKAITKTEEKEDVAETPIAEQ